MVTRRVVAVVSVAVLCLVGCTPTSTETVSPTPPATTSVVTPTPTATPTPEWSGEQQAAVDAVEKWYRIYNEVMRRERGAGDFVLAGRGDVVDEAGKTYNEFALAELTVKGKIAISELSPGAATEKKRQTVAVKLCEDTTGWQVLDKDGKDALSQKSKVIRPLVATAELWPDDGWYVTSITGGGQSCGGSGS